MKQILSELTQMESNPQIKGECQNFLNKEDWKMEIQKQKKDLEVNLQKKYNLIVLLNLTFSKRYATFSHHFWSLY